MVALATMNKILLANDKSMNRGMEAIPVKGFSRVTAFDFYYDVDPNSKPLLIAGDSKVSKRLIVLEISRKLFV